MSAISAIRRYDQFLVGNKRFSLKGPYDVDTSDELFNEKTIAAKERDALAVIRYAVVHLLGWTPKDAMEHMTPEIGSKLRFESVIKYIPYPSDISKADDRKEGYPWLLHQAFPNEIPYDMRSQIISVYEKVLAGERTFPRYMFRENGERKLSILLCDYISKNIPTYEIEDLYKMFADPSSGNRILRKANLYNAYKDFYETPLLFFHSALGKSGDGFYYNYYMFLNAAKKVTEA